MDGTDQWVGGPSVCVIPPDRGRPCLFWLLPLVEIFNNVCITAGQRVIGVLKSVSERVFLRICHHRFGIGPPRHRSVKRNSPKQWRKNGSKNGRLLKGNTVWWHYRIAAPCHFYRVSVECPSAFLCGINDHRYYILYQLPLFFDIPGFPYRIRGLA